MGPIPPQPGRVQARLVVRVAPPERGIAGVATRSDLPIIDGLPNRASRLVHVRAIVESALSQKGADLRKTLGKVSGIDALQGKRADAGRVGDERVRPDEEQLGGGCRVLPL